MNKRICIIIFLLTCRICNAQNLVPNPSFEDTVSCPTSYAQMNTAIAWSNYRGSPDNFNSCNLNFVNVPDNCFGFQYARTGNAYAGFGAYQVGALNGFREALGAQLTQTLIIGQKYYVSFYVSRAKQSTGLINVAINKIGMRLSTVPYASSTPCPLNNIAQVYTDSIVTDTIGWYKIFGSFISDSAYQYLSIGNFFTDSLTSWISVDTVSLLAYYYVDDVILSTDSLLALGISEIKQNNYIRIFPNPFANIIEIRNDKNELSEIIIYDITARKMIQQSFTNLVSLNTEPLAKGIYLYEVRCGSSICKKGKLVKD